MVSLSLFLVALPYNFKSASVTVVERAEAENFNVIRIQNPGRLVNQFLCDDGWREVGE